MGSNNSSLSKGPDVDSEHEDDEFERDRAEATSDALSEDAEAGLNSGKSKGKAAQKTETGSETAEEKQRSKGFSDVVLNFADNLFPTNDGKGKAVPQVEVKAEVKDEKADAAAKRAVAEPKAQTSAPTLLDGDLPGKAATPTEAIIASDTSPAAQVLSIFEQWRRPTGVSLFESPGVQDARRAEKDGDLNKAVELWTKEQEQLKKGYGNDLAVYDTCKELARLYEQMPGKSAEARKQYETALEICKKQYDWSDRWDSKLDPTVTSLHLKIAKTYEAEGNLPKALEQQKLALAVANKGESDYNWAQKKDSLKMECHSAMASTLTKAGKPEEAIKEYQENIKLLKRQSGYSDYGCPQDREIIATQAKMADALVKTGKPDEAVKLHEQNLAIIKRQRDYSDYSANKFDKNVIETQREIAKIRSGQGRYDEALKALDDNSKLLDRKYYMTAYGDKTAVGAVAQNHSDLADLYAKRAESRKDNPDARNADYDKALQERQKELDIYKKNQSWDSRDTKQDPQIFAAQREMAKYLQAQGKDEEALKMQEKQIPLLKRAEAKPADIAACMQKIADGYEKIGKLDQSILMHKQACSQLEGKAGYEAARERLAETYKKAGKDIRTEEAREDKEAFDRCDEIEKFPYIFSKLPQKLAIETSADGTKLSTDNLPKLLEAAPGMMLDKVLKEAFSVGQSPEAAEKMSAAVMQALRDTTDISIKGNKIEFTRKKDTEIPYSVELAIGKLNAIKLGQKVSFEIETDPADPSKIRIKNIEGISAVGERPDFLDWNKKTPISLNLTSLEISEQQDKEGKRSRILSINGAIPVKLSENVSDADSAAYKEHMKLMTDTIGKLGKGDINGLMEMLGAKNLPQPLKDLISDIKAIKKDGGSLHLDLKKAHKMNASDFTGGGAIDGNPTVTISPSVDLYMSSSKYSIDLSGIKGITLDSDGWMGTLLGKGGHLTANLSKLYIGGQSNGERSLNIGFDRGLHSLWVDLNAQGAPRANSTIRMTVDNPVGGKKESVDIKIDENGGLSYKNLAGEALYLFLEGVRRGWLPD